MNRQMDRWKDGWMDRQIDASDNNTPLALGPTSIKINSISFINPLCAKFFRGNINIYLHFVSFLQIDTTQVVEILPQVRQEST